MFRLPEVRADTHFPRGVVIVTGGLDLSPGFLKPIDHARIQFIQLQREQPFAAEVVERHHRRHHMMATSLSQQ